MSLFGLFGPPDIIKLTARRDIEGLIKALSYTKDRSIQRAAAIRLGQLGGPEVIKRLSELLQDSPSFSLRENIILALSQTGDERAIAPLRRVVEQHGCGAVDAGSALTTLALGQPVDSPAVQVLLELLNQPSFGPVQETVVAVVPPLGTVMVRPLLQALQLQLEREAQRVERARKQPASQTLAEALIRVGPPAIAPLVEALDTLAVEPVEQVLIILNKIDPEWRRSPASQALVPSHISHISKREVDLKRRAASVLILKAVEPEWKQVPSAQAGLSELISQLLNALETDQSIAKLVMRSLLRETDLGILPIIARSLGVTGMPKAGVQFIELLRVFQEAVISALIRALLEESPDYPALIPVVSLPLQGSYYSSGRIVIQILREFGWSTSSEVSQLIAWIESLAGISSALTRAASGEPAPRSPQAEFLFPELGLAAEDYLIANTIREVWSKDAADTIPKIALRLETFDPARTVQILTTIFDPSNASRDLQMLRTRRAVILAIKVLRAAGAAGLLVSAMQSKEVTAPAMESLQYLLEQDAQALTKTDLLAMVALGQAKILQLNYHWDSQCQTERWDGEFPVDCSTLVQLARQELVRRGEST